MTNSSYYKNYWVVSLFVAGVLLASVFLFVLTAQAQITTQTTDDPNVQLALDDLSSATGQDIITEALARALCDQEQYWETCADIGKKYNLYTEEEVRHVEDFLSEVKGQVLEDIKACPDEECLIRVANQLAKKVQVNNPTLATNLKLTTKIVEEKSAVVQAAKEVGVNFRDCESMDPDTAPIDLLRKCARLAKDTRVQKYIPEERRSLAAEFEDSATLKLREALSAGAYQCGDNTLDGCGKFCLNPTSAAGVPPVCAQIASDIFGAEGVKQLEAAHQQVGQVKDYYSKKFILTLPSGKQLVGEGQIRNACDQAFSGRNLEIAKACGAFAVQNGFATQAEVDKGLKFIDSFIQRGGDTDFNTCLTNPDSCRDFIPEDERARFDAGSQIFQIMKTEIGFDPSQCERGSVDETIGMKCFEGAKRALAKIESLGLANQSQEARFIVEEIRGHVSEGENMNQRKDEFKQVFSQQGGPGSCRSEAECFTYCSNPANGPECIAFGSKQGVSGFRGDEAVQKFQQYNHNIQKSSDVTSNEYRPYEYRSYPSDGRYSQFPEQGPYPPGQDPRFTQPGPGYSPPPGTAPYYPPYQLPPYPGGPGSGPAGPSPECFAAIQSGDFVKAKAVCETHVPQQPYPSAQICPASPYIECPAGQYRESYRNNDGCWVDGPCKSAPTYSPYPTYSPSSTPSGDPAVDCQKSGGTWDSAAKYCKFLTPTYSPYPTGSPGPYPTYSPGPGSGWINKTWKFKDGSTQSSSILSRTDSEYTGHINSVYNSCSTKYFAGWKPGGGDQNNWQEFGIPVCSDTVSTSPSPYPTYSPGPSPTYSPYPSYTPPGTGSCPSGYHYHGESGGFCMNDQENYGGTCYNSAGTSKITCPAQATSTPYPSPTYSPGPTVSSTTSGCSQSLINLLGTGCHWMYSDSSGRGIYCDGPMSKSAKEGDSATVSGCTSGTGTGTYTPTPSCPTGSYWDYAQNKCSTGSCSAGYYWDSATSTCKISGASYTPYPTCSSGVQWTVANGCSPAPTYTYPSCPSGQWWDTATSSCHSSTTSYTPSPSCPSTQYWNGSACVDNTTTTTYTPYPTTDPSTSCTSSGGTWNGSSCVYPTPIPSESPPPTSMMYQPYMVAHCQQLGRTWDGSGCRANGLFARFYEYYFADSLRALDLIK